MYLRSIGLILMIMVLAACGTRPTEPAPVEDRVGGDQAQTETIETGDGADREGGSLQVGGDRNLENIDIESIEDPSDPLSKRVIYFAYDDASISEDDELVLQAHGEYLAVHPERKVIIEGHTDERGTREYNLALGERRAASVKERLELYGASNDQVEMVSFGEEKPAAEGEGEQAWSQNRRAELIYTQR